MQPTPEQALSNPPGKAVRSTTATANLRDLAGDLARHRVGSDAKVTKPPGGYPRTVGGNPNAPADRQVSDQEYTGVEVQAPGPYSLATKWVGGGANY